MKSFVKTPIYDFVQAYEKSGCARLHMPGHKGKGPLGCEKWDITEVSGADALYEANGIIAESEGIATALFGFGKTFYSTEGSSQCIKAMLALAKLAAPAGSRTILAGRNAHKSFLYGCALLDLDVEWLLAPKRSSLCSNPITPQMVQEALKNCKEKPIAVFITAPDYLGQSPDVAGIAAVCNAAEVPLLVDNAHGAYLRFLETSKHPISLGASMSADSAHKTLPVLTGGAYLQLSQAWAEKMGAQAKKMLEVFGSTSPSYLILQSLDLCNRTLGEDYEKKLQTVCVELERVKKELLAADWQVIPTEPLKITLACGSNGYTGTELAEILRQKNMECEFAGEQYLVMLFSADSTAKEIGKVGRIIRSLPIRQPLPALFMTETLPQKAMPIRQAIFAPGEEIPVEKSIGRICARPSVSCPPAIPIVESGEYITEDMIPLFVAYGIDTIDVVKES